MRLNPRYGVSLLCWYFNCSTSGYYDWVKRGCPIHNKLDTAKAFAISQVHRHRPARGRRQVMMQLERQYGIHMCLGSVHRYMSALGLSSSRKRKFVVPKKETQNLCAFPNVLRQDFRSSLCASVKWVTDITYLPCTDGMLYLSCIKDLSDKSIIAYELSGKNDLLLVMNTLKKAAPQILANTILHSDQGSQYQSPLYHAFLKQHGVIGSMSRKATPYDNAPMESFFSILKNEELKPLRNITCSHMRPVIDRFIHFYNHLRPQMALQKLTPVEYRSQFL